MKIVKILDCNRQGCEWTFEVIFDTGKTDWIILTDLIKDGGLDV